MKSQRELKKITLREIAEKLEISAQQVQKYETGKDRIPVDKLTVYCEILGLQSGWLLEWANGTDV